MAETTEKSDGKQRKFRLNSKGFFLTYPQCPVDRQILADMLAARGSVAKGLIGQELHKDGEKHLHAYVKYISKLDVSNPTYFDLKHEGKVYHGNYQTAKCAIASIKYISKEDQDPLELGDMDYKQEMSAKQSKSKILGKRLAAGEPVDQIIADGNEELIMSYAKVVANQKAYLNDRLP